MLVRRFVSYGCIFSLAAFLPPPQAYRGQVNSLSAPDTVWLSRLLEQRAPHLQPYLKAAQQYRIQIIYTQVNRDAQNRPILKHYAFRLDTNEYFYPASLVKLPLAALALERLGVLKAQGLTVKTPFALQQGSAGCLAQVPLQRYSVEDCIRRQLVYSDNVTFDYLYALVGPSHAMKALRERGYTSVYIGHRLGRSCSPAENRCVEGVTFYRSGKPPYTLPPMCSSDTLRHPYAGHPYLLFANANALSLKDAHAVLISLIFPQAVRPRQRFQLSVEDYLLLRKYLSMYPSEAREADFSPTEYHDGVRKFFLMGGSDSVRLPSRIRIFNKVGLAYGYLSDVAYIVDFDLGVEFFLSAVVYVGESQAGYPSAAGYPYEVGLRFLRELGWVLYRYETTRRKPYFPNLASFRYDYR
ncbi:MAG: hypothetical protein KatS3mg026_0232 [Bacteroidia bacterium]|nr:MAG: hypothetical protein KatS3mg026_0232 [Bacteroidia bacterium]